MTNPYVSRRTLFTAVPLLAALGVGAMVMPSVHAQTSRPLEKITFLLDFIPYGKHAPFYAAMEKGFWRDAGFDATIVKGDGSASTIAAYAAGAVDFAFADTPVLIIARSKGAKIKVAAMIHDKSLYSVGTLVENNINTIADLKGKRIGSSVGDAGRNLFPGLAKLNNLNPAEVRWVDMTPPARGPSLVLGQVDAVTLFLTETPTFAAKMKESGKTWKDLPFADFGMDLYSSGILVRDELAANNPDRVKRFIDATMKAWAWSIENPQDAMAAFLKHNPAVDRGQATEHFRIAIRHMLTDYAKKEGIGVMDPAKMKITVERVSEYFGVSGVAPEDIYTNQFAPKGIHPKETSF